jgi:DNA-binding NarL/FixJ family response regulator
MNFFKLPVKVHDLEKPSDSLSKRTIDIIRMAAKGMTNKKIADELHISTRTVEGHMRAIFNKLGVGSRTEAVLYGIRQGWFTLDELS